MEEHEEEEEETEEVWILKIENDYEERASAIKIREERKEYDSPPQPIYAASDEWNFSTLKPMGEASPEFESLESWNGTKYLNR